MSAPKRRAERSRATSGPRGNPTGGAPRRVGSRLAGGGPAATASIVALVLLTVVALAMLPRAVSASQRAAKQGASVASSTATRELVCPGHGPVAHVVATTGLDGSSAGVRTGGSRTVLGPGQSREVSKSGIGAVVLRTTSTGVLASQVSDTSADLAPCLEPRTSWWFTGAGAGKGPAPHSSRIILVNSRPGVAIVNLDVFGPRGRVEAPEARGISVASGAEVVVDLARVAPAKGDLAVQVSTTRGLVVAAMSEDLVDPSGTTTSVWLPASAAPATSNTILGLPGFAAGDRAEENLALVVANPGDREAVVRVSVTNANGSFAPDGLAAVRVPAGSTRTVDATSAMGADGLGLLLSSQGPVAASLRVTTPTALVGVPSGTAYPGAAGLVLDPTVTAQLALLAPRDPALAEVTVVGTDGKVLFERRVRLSKGAVSVLELPAKPGTVVVSATGEVVATVLTKRGASAGLSGLVRPNPARAAITVRPH